jgi:ketosteroid isomerase-like protein
MKHPNALILEKIYRDFTSGNYIEMLDACADEFTFQLAGKSPLAGKYNRTNFLTGFVQKLKDISGGTYEMQIHDVMASDQHGIVLSTVKVTVGGTTHELRTVHVWRMPNGKPVAAYEYPRDLYQLDQVWS